MIFLSIDDIHQRNTDYYGLPKLINECSTYYEIPF